MRAGTCADHVTGPVEHLGISEKSDAVLEIDRSQGKKRV